MHPVSFRSPRSCDPNTDREQSSRTTPSVQALSACYTSAKENLHIVSDDFASMSMLVSHFPHYIGCLDYTFTLYQRYGQDSITVMTAYAAVFLLKVG